MARKRHKNSAHQPRGQRYDNPSMKVEKAQVPDPFAPDRMLVVERNTRTDPIEYLAARHRIDPVQKRAADRFLALWEAAAYSGLSSVDPAREQVDASPFTGGRSDRSLEAQQSLSQVRRLIGRSGYTLLVAVCGERHAIGDAAAGLYEHSRRAEFLVRTRINEILTELAEHWGYVNRPVSAERNIRSSMASDRRPLLAKHISCEPADTPADRHDPQSKGRCRG